MQATARRMEKVVMRYKRDKAWQDITGAQLMGRIRHIALALHERGVRKGDRVSILAESCPEWSITDYAILASGGVTVPIYPTQAVDQVAYILKNCEARVLFISNQKLLRRVQSALDPLKGDAPQLILFDEKSEGLETLDAFASKGVDVAARSPELFDTLVAQATPDDLATIIYTSGTTGEPKGVMLSHRNLVFDAVSSGKHLGPDINDVFLSFLPLSHVFERTVLYLLMNCDVQICYARGIETVAEDLKEIHPTIVTAVPRLFEKIYATINKRAADQPPMKQRIFQRAIKVGREVAVLKDQRKSVPFTLAIQHKVLDGLVFSKWREAVGGKIRFFVSGGAALPKELGLIFSAAGIEILQGYGLTETSPVVACNKPGNNRFGTIGQPIEGVKVKIAEDGELLVQGDLVMQGYYKLPEATAEMIKEYPDGIWLHTGDIGEMDAEGFLKITDRKKDLIKTNLGKYIAPQQIENLIGGIPLVEQVIIIGNQRKYPSALIVPNYDALKTYASSIALDTKDKTTLAKHPRILEFFKKKVDEVTRELAPHEKVKKIALLTDEFTIDGGELTPSLKIRRKFVEDKYRDLIDSLYPKNEALEG
ncbi:MAG: long-chain fatty acid--CoA ligase [Acidobacteria bacterium]|nr:long-chain fatty acid--CoA ligase [Acidobacteriota bacterium]